MKDFLKRTNLSWSDLLIVTGFAPFVIFLFCSVYFIERPNPVDVGFPLWAVITCFAFIVLSWGTYTYLSFKKGNKPHRYITISFLFILVVGVVSILVQPSNFVEDVIVRVAGEHAIGDIVTVSLNISPLHYTFFCLHFVSSLLFIYVGLFVFPKKIKNAEFITLLGILYLICVLTMFIYSYILETNNYIGFFKYLFGKGNEGDTIYTYAVDSYCGHRNVYGMALMIGILFSLIEHAINHKWYYYLITGLIFINMLFTVSKTSIILTVIIILAYLIYRLITTYKNHVKRNKIIIFACISLILIILILIGIALISRGQILGSLYSFIVSLGGSNTLQTRSYIWANSFQLLNSPWWLIGRGTGLFNEMLLPMNAVNGDPVFPAHNAYIALLGEGGVIFLIAYIALLSYTGYITYKCFKVNKGLTLTIMLGIIALLIYSLIESIQYVVYVFVALMLITYNIINEQAKIRADN